MLKFDSLNHPYSSRRSVTMARNGMVATSQPLAANAGLEILKQGGNAIDAAVATAACLTVVEPTSNGIGGDAFALVWHQGKLHGLNSSGPSPEQISREALIKKGYDKVPNFGVLPVTVPGAPASWVELNEQMGRLPLEKVLEPAIEYARKGFPITPVLGKNWDRAFNKYKQEWQGEEYSEWFRVFAPHGRAPMIGEMWSSQDHGDTLEKIAETRGDYFYKGELADNVDYFFKKYGGYLRGSDLESFTPEWVDPISLNYRGYDIWEIPPNGQGIVALMALNILQHDDFESKELLSTYHRQIEALKLAFIDGKKYITDPHHMKVDIDDLLSEDYARERRALIKDEAITPEPGSPPRGGTVYLATADGEGNMVSFIQSNYMGFGSGIVLPGTGVAFQNRGCSFSLDSSHDNVLESGKKTYHTIIPGFMSKGKDPIGPFGVMGGFMQPQGHLQVVMNTVDFDLNPQAALDAPRWQWIKDKQVSVERKLPAHIAEGLYRRGHDINVSLDSGSFGRGQIIWRDPQSGVLFGGTEPRTDGSIAVY
ncbi:gamma-glutamyltransferase family protein [Natranaerobius thermophilus]|uniref:Gamma-glutamyltransferase 2. Threonine peptidase. MEROPS family T03 n=1 Tax=Natranaerobius thermophilus (strain ATCC BAA-1301 / DSM 18059 / JW/NM-WN-LF) TaxID=457570 RepID=B2A3C8_NATTJ|nr:gamma-glutamyltransferase family protein [Natranaerobius thermophilus]ACB86357.1 gamma-glutamyltransferase 2. Threonine peptidase. MEROPS family T03 [Natranaerobius thermophilus JW/NM-WN-LF]